MGSNRAALAAIALACVAAAGAGGYFALRQNTATDTSPVAATAPVTTTAAAPVGEPAVATGKSVQETEDIVAPSEKGFAKAPKKVEAKPEKAPLRNTSAPAARPTSTVPAPLPAPAPEPVAPPRTETIERVAQDAPPP